MDEKDQKKDILKVKEAGELLGLSPQAIYHEVYLGRIPHYKINTRVRFSRKKLLRWLEVNKRGPECQD